MDPDKRRWPAIPASGGNRHPGRGGGNSWTVSSVLVHHQTAALTVTKHPTPRAPAAGSSPFPGGHFGSRSRLRTGWPLLCTGPGLYRPTTDKTVYVSGRSRRDLEAGQATRPAAGDGGMIAASAPGAPDHRHHQRSELGCITPAGQRQRPGGPRSPTSTAARAGTDLGFTTTRKRRGHPRAPPAYGGHARDSCCLTDNGGLTWHAVHVSEIPDPNPNGL